MGEGEEKEGGRGVKGVGGGRRFGRRGGAPVGTWCCGAPRRGRSGLGRQHRAGTGAGWSGAGSRPLGEGCSGGVSSLTGPMHEQSVCPWPERACGHRDEL